MSLFCREQSEKMYMPLIDALSPQPDTTTRYHNQIPQPDTTTRYQLSMHYTITLFFCSKRLRKFYRISFTETRQMDKKLEQGKFEFGHGFQISYEIQLCYDL